MVRIYTISCVNSSTHRCEHTLLMLLILDGTRPGAGKLFARRQRRSYVHRLRQYAGDAFFDLLKKVGGFQLSIPKWCDGRDGDSQTLARDLSASVGSQRTELRRVNRDYLGDEEPSEIVRQTVELLVDCKLVQGPDLADGPILVELGGDPAVFLVAAQTAALAAHCQGLIDLELRLWYLAACMYGVYLILGCFFRLFYFDADGNPQKNALGLHVLFIVIKPQLVEFKLIVFNGFVIMQLQTETVHLGIAGYFAAFQAVAGRPLPAGWRDHCVATADDDDDMADGPSVPAVLANLSAPTVAVAGVETYVLQGLLGGRSTVVQKWEYRYQENIRDALDDPVFGAVEAVDERTHLRTLRDEGALPPWLPLERFEPRELETYLRDGYARCASLARAERITVGESRTVVACVWLRGARADTQEMPGLVLTRIPKPHQLIFTGSLGRTLAAYWALSLTPIFLLMCIVNTMRWRWDGGLPPTGLTPNGRFNVRTLRFYEPSPKNLLWFLCRA